jgi:hypothetical protein
MSYKYKTNLEEVAAALQALKWKEMDELAFYFSTLEISDLSGPHFWSSVFHDWSSYKMAEFEARVKEGEAK